MGSPSSPLAPPLCMRQRAEEDGKHPGSVTYLKRGITSAGLTGKPVFIHSSPIFPHMQYRLLILSSEMNSLINRVREAGKPSMIGVVSHKPVELEGADSANEMEASSSYYKVGCWAKIIGVSKLLEDDKNALFPPIINEVKLDVLDEHSAEKKKYSAILIVEGKARFFIKESSKISENLLSANFELLSDILDPSDSVGLEAHRICLQQMIMEYLTRKLPNRTNFIDQVLSSNSIVNNPSSFADFAASLLPRGCLKSKQEALEELNVKLRIQKLEKYFLEVLETARLSEKITSNLNKQIDKELKESLIRRKIEGLHKELKSLRKGRNEAVAKVNESVSTPSPKPFTEEGKNSTKNSQNGVEDSSKSWLEEENSGVEDTLTYLERTLRTAGMNAEATAVAKRELKRLEAMIPQHPEYTITRTYLENLASIPWCVESQDQMDLQIARKILDEDHYGIESVKVRILEFLAVRKLRKHTKGTIMCLCGPPGVGKTSLGRSIARAMDRKFCRISLGGLRDEAELRGHRRTYIGALPGSIIRSLIHCKVRNPVMLLDEIDKLPHDNPLYNPAAALLEILDSEQNNTFMDRYIGAPFDLSQVLFVCTANTMATMSKPLRDRLEIISLSGYTNYEKFKIAKGYIIPKQLKLAGLVAELSSEPRVCENSKLLTDAEAFPNCLNGQCTYTAGDAKKEGEEECSKASAIKNSGMSCLLSISDDSCRDIIDNYTAESGVRELERSIAAVCRWAALKIDEGNRPDLEKAIELPLKVTKDMLQNILGNQKLHHNATERLRIPGVAIGLAVNQAGGEILFIEAAKLQGTGNLIVTGQIGDVMQESVRAALTYMQSAMNNGDSSLQQYFQAVDNPQDGISSKDITDSTLADAVAPSLRSRWLQIPNSRTDELSAPNANIDIHVHFPAGATPKDGPSAGISAAVALLSLFLGRIVRNDTAFTGEITLRGNILRVGGIREKAIAAHRAKISRIVIPKENEADMVDIPEEVTSEMEIFCVRTVDEALQYAFYPLEVQLSLETSNTRIQTRDNLSKFTKELRQSKIFCAL